ncbi:UNVERIFIED_CONTAM: putative indole-3-pyruvate monooxygenase YUCCA10 [Sesamum calycinum]|uniref:Flavin-containing monooxygenase n=1 Tax=Sesamum calycinum TaxID=2727403 RepID=A0AAW2SAP7_9LAMI
MAEQREEAVVIVGAGPSGLATAACTGLVEAASYDEVSGKWRIKARDLESGEAEEYTSRFLVVATGETCDPKIPKVEGLESFGGEILHSTEYKNGEKFKGKRVLVVGSGNSGMEIALDLANSGAKTSIVVRSPIHILSRGMMDAAMKLLKPEEGPFTVKLKYGKFPVIDVVGTFNKIKSGEIEVLPAGIRSIKGNTVLFENENEHTFNVIVFATGFKRSTKQWLKGEDVDSLLNDDGFAKSFPNHWKGKKGLYCAGLAQKGFYRTLPVTSRPYSYSENILFTIHICV